jgi:hypothetical protein
MTMIGLGTLLLPTVAGALAAVAGLLLLRSEVASLTRGGALRVLFLTVARFAIAAAVFFVLVHEGLAQAIAGLCGYSLAVLVMTFLTRSRDARRFTT